MAVPPSSWNFHNEFRDEANLTYCSTHSRDSTCVNPCLGSLQNGRRWSKVSYFCNSKSTMHIVNKHIRRKNLNLSPICYLLAAHILLPIYRQKLYNQRISQSHAM
uniref:Uncharacterized protein n=1 Tax=Micrurus spixii TaxID=129469 RepID=A0A2D4M6A6_9SAUR